MGHYYSEMVSDKEQEEEARRVEENLQRRAKEIQERIDKKGLAYVLAELTTRFR